MTGLAEHGETHGLPGMGPGLDRQEAVGCVFRRLWNRTEPFFRSKPRPLAGCPDPSLTLLHCDSRCSLTCCWGSQARRRRAQVCRSLSQVLPGAHKVLSVAPRCSQPYHNHSHGTPVPVIRDPSYSEGWPEYPPRV